MNFIVPQRNFVLGLSALCKTLPYFANVYSMPTHLIVVINIHYHKALKGTLGMPGEETWLLAAVVP